MELGVAKARQSSWHRLLPARSCGWGKAGLTQNFPPPILAGLKMTTATRQEVLGLYRSIFRLARKWQAASGQMEDTIKEKQYILNEARTLFQKNKNITDPDLIKQCIDECTARIEIGLHYQIPYPRPIHLPPMGLTPLTRPETTNPGETEKTFQTSVSAVSRRNFLMERTIGF